MGPDDGRIRLHYISTYIVSSYRVYIGWNGIIFMKFMLSNVTFNMRSLLKILAADFSAINKTLKPYNVWYIITHLIFAIVAINPWLPNKRVICVISISDQDEVIIPSVFIGESDGLMIQNSYTYDKEWVGFLNTVMVDLVLYWHDSIRFYPCCQLRATYSGALNIHIYIEVQIRTGAFVSRWNVERLWIMRNSVTWTCFDQ